MMDTNEESNEHPVVDPLSPMSCLYGMGPKMIDVHFTTLPPPTLTSLTIDSESEIPKSCFPSPVSSVDGVTANVNSGAHLELAEISSQEYVRTLDDEDRDSIARQCAKIVLRIMMRHPREVHIANQNAEWLPRKFLTQSTIKWHISVLKEMVEISQMEMTPVNIIMCTCRMLEIPSISTISGRRFRYMRLSDQVDVVLAIARQFADLYWREHDDATYEVYHRMLDQQAWHYIRTTHHTGEATCCVVI